MGWGVNTTHQPLFPQERPGTHSVGGWVVPRAGLDVCRKSHSPLGYYPRTVQPVASCDIDYVFLTHTKTSTIIK